VGVDDGRFNFRQPRNYDRDKVLLAAVLFEGTRLIALRLGKITIDGLDATATLIRLLNGINFDAVFLSGISFAGFNLIDPFRVHLEYRKPVIIISGSRPNNRSVKRALRLHFKDWKIRWAIIRKLGPIHRVRSCAAEPPLFFEVVGTSTGRARRVIKESAKLSRLPEPIRVVSLVAKGLSDNRMKIPRVRRST